MWYTFVIHIWPTGLSLTSPIYIVVLIDTSEHGCLRTQHKVPVCLWWKAKSPTCTGPESSPAQSCIASPVDEHSLGQPLGLSLLPLEPIRETQKTLLIFKYCKTKMFSGKPRMCSRNLEKNKWSLCAAPPDKPCCFQTMIRCAAHVAMKNMSNLRNKTSQMVGSSVCLQHISALYSICVIGNLTTPIFPNAH